MPHECVNSEVPGGHWRMVEADAIRELVNAPLVAHAAMTEFVDGAIDHARHDRANMVFWSLHLDPITPVLETLKEPSRRALLSVAIADANAEDMLVPVFDQSETIHATQITAESLIGNQRQFGEKLIYGNHTSHNPG